MKQHTPENIRRSLLCGCLAASALFCAPASATETPGVYITEVCSAHAPKSGEADWVELYNGGPEEIALDGWTVSDRAEKDGLTLSGTLPAGAYRVVSLKDASFGLSAAGETVFLKDASGALTDSFPFGATTAGVTAGRKSRSGACEYYTQATPGAENAKGYAARCDIPEVSETALYHSEPFSVVLSCADPAAELRYTLDGTVPRLDSALYTEPLRIEKTTVLRVIAVKDGALNSHETAYTYLFGAPHTLPVVCVTGAPEDLKEVFKKSSGHHRPEVKVRAAWYEANGSFATAFPGDLRIKGNASTSNAYPQKSLTLHLRSGYGQSEAVYPFFGGDEADVLTGFTLRSGGQDSNRTRIKDVFASRVAMGTYSEAARTRAVIVYRNGTYAGVYWFTENINEDHLAEKYGLKSEEIEITDRVHGVQAGSGKYYRAALEYARKNNLRDRENYEAFAAKVDIASLTDTLILKMFLCDVDLYNQRWWAGKDGVLHSVFFDNDLILMQGKENAETVERMFRTGSGKYGGNVFYAALRKNKGWREYFLDRYAELLAGTLSEERLVSLFDATAEEIRPEMPRHLKLYGKPKTTDDWEKYVSIARKELLKKRADVTEQVRKEFGLTKEEMDERICNAAEKTR
ncbi:MAG: CotH kinase family protein [Clostridia bacterium]|nr:CotH kinase family protein [Clostridia bacterium]